MKQKNIISLSILFLVISMVFFCSCESMGKIKDPNGLSIKGSIPVEVKFSIPIDIQQFNLQITSAPELKTAAEGCLRATNERVVYSGILKWDFDKIGQKAHLGSQSIKKFDIKEVTILPQIPQDFNVGFFRITTIYSGNNNTLFAISDKSTDPSKITFSLKQNDLLALLKQNELPIKVVTTQTKKIESVQTLTLQIKYKGSIEIE